MYKICIMELRRFELFYIERVIYNYGFLKDCSNLMRRMNCTSETLDTLLQHSQFTTYVHGIAFHPATHQQSLKSNHYVISLDDMILAPFSPEKA